MDDGKADTMSAAEKRVRDATAAIVERATSGSKPMTALARSGFNYPQSTAILKIGNGGDPSVTDEGYRDACESLVQAMNVAVATVDDELADRWTALAKKGDDWRSIAELLKRRNPDEWAVTERSEVELAGGVEVRTNDAVLAALEALRGDTSNNAAA